MTNTPKVTVFALTRKGHTNEEGRKLISFIGRSKRTLEEARAQRQKALKVKKEPLAIYALTYGELPRFVEGDRLH